MEGVETIQLWDGEGRCYPTVGWRGDGLSTCGMDGGGRDYPAIRWRRDYPTVGGRGDGLSSCGMEDVRTILL